jgi:imidazolonepropionase-like amidohydrolase
MKRLLALLSIAIAGLAAAADEAVRVLDDAQFALVGVDLIDGTGAPLRPDMTVVVRDGRIAAVGPRATTPVPDGARAIELAGHVLTPGFVLMHEHLFYPVSYSPRGFAYTNIGSAFESFPALYLAGGATTIRTAGSVSPYADVNARDAVRAGRQWGPDMALTAPFVNGPQLMFMQMRNLRTPAEVARFVAHWHGQGMDSFKAYMSLQPAQLGALVRAAHQRGAKVTGHLCATSYEEAARLGIDNLEHGFWAATDFMARRTPGECDFGAAWQSLEALQPDDPRIDRLIRLLVQRKVALTSTPAVLEPYDGADGEAGHDHGAAPGLCVLAPPLRDAVIAGARERSAQQSDAQRARRQALSDKMLALELRFAAAGGLLMLGTDPTGDGHVVPGYGGLRAMQLLQRAGLAPEQVVKVASLNGATYLGRQREIGSVVPGKRADLVLLRREGAATAIDLWSMPQLRWVFKAGVAHDAAALVRSVEGMAGLR